MKEIIIRDWSHLQEILFQDTWNEEISRYRSTFAFRGLSDKSYSLDTSLMRLGGPYWQLEQHLLRNFRKYTQTANGEVGSLWQLLALAQHHGLPTRLMDWTYSPYVALHFATANIDRFNVDGVIWVVDYHRAHRLLPEPLQELLASDGAHAFTIELLTNILRSDQNAAIENRSFHELVASLKTFDALGQNGDFLLFLEPPSIDQRIVNQFALFSLMPNPRRRIDSWLMQQEEFYRKIIIPKEIKWECRDKLDQCNITERVLFPGLDGLSLWLKRHYSPKT